MRALQQVILKTEERLARMHNRIEQLEAQNTHLQAHCDDLIDQVAKIRRTLLVGPPFAVVSATCAQYRAAVDWTILAIVRASTDGSFQVVSVLVVRPKTESKDEFLALLETCTSLADLKQLPVATMATAG